jgi:EAL domain-containing protein (putative c-di-GMP-specific phosphodiesterase class I)/GGDEF domain-containing protein
MTRDAARHASKPPVPSRLSGALIGCAAAAAALPGLLMLRGGPSREALIAFASSLAAVGLILYLTRPLAAVARILQFCLAETEGEAERAGPPRAGLAGQAAELADRIGHLRQRLGNRHPVTGLPTREPFLAEVARDVDGRDDEVVLGVVRFADYDRLAGFDQAAAELALKAFSARLRETMPKGRPLAQVDRDCFAAWFRDSDRDQAARELQALVYVMEQELQAGEARLTPRTSIGVAVFPGDSRAPTELLTRAVAALDGGRGGKVSFFSAQSSAVARERFSLEQDLGGAVERGELMLQFQPLVDLDAGRAVGAEALLRWRRPGLGLVGPATFVPILEQSRLMGEVGLWVLNTACREARSWREKGLGELKMAVNLSAAQCDDPRLCELVLKTLERHGLPPSSLELELTETAAMEDADHIRRLFTDLRSLGVGVAIDDFGAGYSSLSYLKNLPFSKLKIDREFVKDVNQGRDSRAICAALLALSHGLGISVLAEGVERPDQVATLHEMGCSLFQGYVFARPLDGDAFVSTVTDPEWLASIAALRAQPPEPRRLAG